MAKPRLRTSKTLATLSRVGREKVGKGTREQGTESLRKVAEANGSITERL